MTKKLIILFSLLSQTPFYAQNQCDNIKSFTDFMTSHHVQAREINDKFSEDVYHQFLERLDENGLYFTKEDEAIFSDFKLNIDDYIHHSDCSFLQEFARCYKARLTRIKKHVNIVLANPLDYHKQDSLQYFKHTTHKHIITRTEKEQLEVWNKYLKNLILEDMFSTDDTTIVTVEAALKKEETSRNLVLTAVNYTLDDILTLDSMEYRYFINYEFKNAIAKVYDPHSDYFSEYDKEKFEESLSKEIASFGINIGQNEAGEVIITELLPGGAAWNSNELNVGDIITGLKIGNKKILTSSLSFEEFASLLNSKDFSEVEIMIKKKKKDISKKIKLEKTTTEVSENVLKSFILNGQEKVGYLALPSFYTEWEENNSRPLGCANDVAKELLKLKNEGIKGLILDLRYNGGGSLYEAMGLAGIFIDWGPLLVQQPTGEKAILLKDLNRGIMYTDPLIILVNGFSASASEVFAAALQDYNRALIVGENTFGKSTAQQILPLEQNNSSNENIINEFVKLTNTKLYRITQQTHQFVGVTPDIKLPDILAGYDITERSYPHALKPDTIDKTIYYKALSELPIAQLNANSQKRIKADSNFIAIIKLKNELIAQNTNGKKSIPLSIEEYNTYSERAYWNEFEEYTHRKTSLFEATENQYAKELMAIDKNTVKIFDALKQKISKDIYISESYQIMLEFLKINNE